METSALVFTAIMPIFMIIAAGFGARRIGWLSEEADRSLMSLVVNLLYPAFIFSYILNNEALRSPANIVLAPLFGFTAIVAGFGLCMLAARFFSIGNQKESRTFAFTTGLPNYGYFPVPIIALLFDRETTGVLLVHNVGVEIAMWSLGVGFILSSHDSKPVWRRILSAPVVSILIAVPLNLLRVDEHLPQFSFEAIDLLGRCAIPLGLLLIGATFADLARGVNLLKGVRLPAIAIGLRMGILPAAFLVFAFIFPFSPELKQVIVVQAAMPSAVFPIVLAKHYNGSPEVALKIVLATTLISLLTIPLWISLGLNIIGF